MELIKFLGNRATSVVKQGKYRISNKIGQPVVEVVIETSDDMRIYPSSSAHPELVEMVNRVKREAGLGECGQFYINEYRQVIVPATNDDGDRSVEYYLAGEYTKDIVLTLDGEEFSGRPIDSAGRLLAPGDSWSGRPRPGIRYKLKAGGADIEFAVKISPGREKIWKLSKVTGPTTAKKTAAKIARVKGNRGGSFFVNEYRAIFCPVRETDFTEWQFVGLLTEEDPWFPKWQPDGSASAGKQSAGSISEVAPSPVASERETIQPAPAPRTIEIDDGASGYTYDNLFAPYLRGASEVLLEDSYLARPHQVGNLLRFAELCVRLGSVRKLKVITRERSQDSEAKIETIRRSLERNGVEFELDYDDTLHDRLIATDAGWKIALGRGLDMYKRPDDFLEVGATDFALRPCHKTRIVISRSNAEEGFREEWERMQI